MTFFANIAAARNGEFMPLSLNYAIFVSKFKFSFIYKVQSTMSYQKFYTNPIQSSSLLCQLASMWKNDIMCDAVIKTGNVNTKVRCKLLT